MGVRANVTSVVHKHTFMHEITRLNSRFGIKVKVRGRIIREGYIDNSGDIVIEPQFEVAGVFSEGMGHVMLGNSVGYIDVTGKLVIPAQFSFAYSFTEGL